MSQRKTDLGILRPKKSAKVVLARVSAAEEEARTLEAQNNTLCGQHD